MKQEHHCRPWDDKCRCAELFPIPNRKLVELDRNNGGDAFIGLTVIDGATGLGIRSSVLSSGKVVDRIMAKRYRDLMDIARPEVEFAITDDYTKGL